MKKIKRLNKRYIIQLNTYNQGKYVWESIKYFDSLELAFKSISKLKQNCRNMFYSNQFDFDYRIWDKEQNIVVIF